MSDKTKTIHNLWDEFKNDVFKKENRTVVIELSEYSFYSAIVGFVELINTTNFDGEDFLNVNKELRDYIGHMKTKKIGTIH